MSSYMVPSVVETTPKGERYSDVFSRLLSERIVFLGTPIDDGVANTVIAQMLHLAADSPARDIHLYINSPGGSSSATMAIYDTMQFVSCEVATLCVGRAGATSALLLAAGTPGKRSMLPHARVVLHQPHVDSSHGSLSDLALEAAELARVRAEAEAVLATHCRRQPSEVRADTERALVLAAQAAVDYGVVDGVLGTPSTAASGGAELRPVAARTGA